MSGGAFRDASAALERVARLEEENQELRDDLAKLDRLRNAAAELESLRAEVKALREVARGDNEDAFVRRLSEERDELTANVRELKDRLAQQDRELVKLRHQIYQVGRPSTVEGFFRRIFGRD